jgi:hypothetical protein
VVQDFSGLEENFNATVPDKFKFRITFQAHDFFTPQPVKNADVYFLRHILHDWADTKAVDILQNIVPAMKDGARIVVADRVLPPPGSVPMTQERMIRAADIEMMTMLNSKERTREDWIALFEKADKRLKVKDFVQPLGMQDTFIKVVFNAT